MSKFVYLVEQYWETGNRHLGAFSTFSKADKAAKEFCKAYYGATESIDNEMLLNMEEYFEAVYGDITSNFFTVTEVEVQ